MVLTKQDIMLKTGYSCIAAPSPQLPAPAEHWNGRTLDGCDAHRWPWHGLTAPGSVSIAMACCGELQQARTARQWGIVVARPWTLAVTHSRHEGVR
jgi:hypothetical protein